MNYPNYQTYPMQGYLRYGQNPYQQQMPVQQPVAPQQMQGYSPASMPVSSREEAMAAPADFSGAPMLFADFSHGKIYVKQWNNQKGAADFVVFAPEVQAEEPKPEETPADCVTKAEFRREMEKLYAEIGRLKGETRRETESE